ncbi:MAG TPA: hypothetical protein VJ931_09130 [Actinomycetota bacterium]|nr:hypothetical protein [Actinomycetota bacterium]
MPRMHVFVPDEVLALIQERPELNWSRLFQEAVRSVAGCDHERMACRRCDQPVHLDALREEWLVGFFTELTAALEVLVDNAGTAQGAAMALRDVGIRWRIPGARSYRPPRPGRAALERRRAREAGWVEQIPSPQRTPRRRNQRGERSA